MIQDSIQQPLFPIGEVSRLTGINSITIRAWERRYNLIEPMRTDSGHRLYSMEQVEFLKKVLTYTERGLPISKVNEIISTESLEIEQNTSLEFNIENFVETLSRKDVEFTNRTLDRLFADNPSYVALYNLIQVGERLRDDHPELQAYWQSFIQPRLNTRLYQTLRLNASHSSNAVVYSLSKFSLNVAIISAICLAEQGYYPLISHDLPNTENCLNSLQSQNAQSVVWCYESLEDLNPFSDWILKHGSFNALLVGADTAPILEKQLHVAHHSMTSANQLRTLSFDF